MLLVAPMLFSCGEKEEDKEGKDKKETSEAGQESPEESEEGTEEQIELGFRDLNVEEFALFVEDPNAVILDVRTESEWKENGVIDSSALTIDWYDEDFKSKVENGISKDKSVYVYCHGGGRSAEAADSLISMGYNNVYNLEEGFMSWQSSGKNIINISED